MPVSTHSGSYNIRGICVRVEGSAGPYFDSELWFYRAPCSSPQIVVKEAEGLDSRPFYELLRMREGRRRLHLPFGDIDSGALEITYEPGLSPAYVFYIFEAVLHLILLERGIALAHGAAFTLGGRGVWVTSWGGTGKTNLLLHMIESGGGFGYMSDDWAIIGDTLAAYPKRMRIYGYNAAAYPRLGLGGRRLALAHRLFKAAQDTIPSRLARIALARIEPRAAIPPYRIPGVEVVGEAEPGLVVFMKKAPVEKPVIGDVDPMYVARAVTACVRFERNYLFMDYYRYLHYTGRPVDIIERHDEALQEVLRRFLGRAGRLVELRVPMKVGPREAAEIARAIREALGQPVNT